MNRQLFQIIDANLNRAREGLRVCEDISRFAIADKNITKALKLIRHNATRILLHSKNLSLKKLLQTRDTERDVLKLVDLKRHKKADIEAVLMANIERAKESLRVLEECCKVIDENASRKYRRLRFNTYDAEKKIAGRIRYISCN